MKRLFMSVLSVLLLLSVFLTAVTASAAAPKLAPLKPGARDKCPVCGMFVAKYPSFAAQVRFADGSAAFFDGNKDLFTYYRNFSRFEPRRKLADLRAIFVSDYYTLNPIDGLSAWYVAGSDIMGPMGPELIPFAREADAREFFKDHKGKSIHRFPKVTPALLKGL